MSWSDALRAFVNTHPATELGPESEATAIGREFFGAEVYPRFERLCATLKEEGHDAILWPSSAPTAGNTWLLESCSIKVFRASESGREVAALASVEVSYRRALLCDTEIHTREGRLNLGVFSLAGDPIAHVDAVLRSFGTNVAASR